MIARVSVRPATHEAAMKEGVQGSHCVIAIITGVERASDPEDNAYFRRPYCVNELRWAREAKKPIQPVIIPEDKGRIGELLQLAPVDLQDLGQVADFIHLDRSRSSYWRAGMDDLLKNIARQCSGQRFNEGNGSRRPECIASMIRAHGVLEHQSG